VTRTAAVLQGEQIQGARLERRAGEVRRELERAVGYSSKVSAMKTRAPIKALQDEHDAIAQCLAAMTDEGEWLPYSPPPQLDTWLTWSDNTDGQSDALITILRRLISIVTIHAEPENGPVTGTRYTPRPNFRDFVPWRFSDAAQLVAWLVPCSGVR
jgi:hypothetical protein